jgi:hypothetical protein
VPTISANGGAERYWRGRGGARLVLCRNGRLLLREAGKRWWQDASLITVEEIAGDKAWRVDTSPRASASVTRTHRISRRGGNEDHG